MTSTPASFLSTNRHHSKSLFMRASTRNSLQKISESEALPKYVLHEVNHYRQRFNWDCGVSCVLMLLPGDQRRQFLENFSNICKEEGFGESTWTMDLCYLLKRFNIEHRMYSTAIGVNEDLKKLSYYDNIMDKDRDRIGLRFEEAQSLGIDIREGKLSNDMIKRHLIDHGPVILLVDSGLLVCDLCKHNKLKYEFRKLMGGTYCGHYILLTGFTRDKFLYRDPGLSERICAISFHRLAEARSAAGTDNDILCIYMNKNR
ncbi:hypothetical protein O0L34_g14193 [Tuta absoluta]|nr:hypothetical protein O0L34_g14193 [Tuta absoluta]